MYNCLVVTGTWLDYDFPNLSHHIGNGIIIPAAETTPSFFSGVGGSTTNQIPG